MNFIQGFNYTYGTCVRQAVAQQRVAIVGEGSLFDEAITQLLVERTDLLISHTIFSDEVAFLDMIRLDPPNAILMCESDTLDTDQVIDSISVDPLVIGLCILVIRLSSTVIEVYERPILNAGKKSHRPRRIIAHTADDLINTLMESVR